tara:strand:+ start:119 stop:589 length:471 start_codon:yes stop_codon:yes gene_type:complete
MLDIQSVSAHCDIPCKIYDPAVAQVAALSIARLLDLIQEVNLNGDSLAANAQLSRLVAEKEAEARIVKEEVMIIWGDYFKEPQLEKFPETHELVHSLMQIASKCKQSVDPENGNELIKQLNRFTEIFWATKGVATHLVVAPYPPALQIIKPVLENA